jgi:hypothetical protein
MKGMGACPAFLRPALFDNYDTKNAAERYAGLLKSVAELFEKKTGGRFQI